MKKKIALLLTLFTVGLLAQPAFADSAPGDRVITLGNDLTAEQKTQILTDFAPADKVPVVIVTHADEEKALKGLVPDAVIGTRAISSCRITFKKPGEGITVTTKNITWVTPDMFKNALVTAGVKDADVYVDAPFPVSGTAALTGITKAFEAATGQTLGSDRKQAANQEMATTAQLGQAIGSPDKAAALINRLKFEVSKANPQTDDQYRSLIKKTADEMGISLTPQQIDSLVDLFKKINALHIDWNAVAHQATNLRDQMNRFMQQNPTQANAIVEFFKNIIYEIAKLIKSLTS